MDHFESDCAIVPLVVSAVNDGHPTAADFPLYSIVPGNCIGDNVSHLSNLHGDPVGGLKGELGGRRHVSAYYAVSNKAVIRVGNADDKYCGLWRHTDFD